MSVQSEITRLETARSAIRTAIINKGVSVPETAKLDELATYIGNIEKIRTRMPPITMDADGSQRGNITGISVGV